MSEAAFRGYDLSRLWTAEMLGTAARAAALIIILIPLLFGVSKWLRLYLSKRFSPQQGMLFSKILLYSGLAIIAVTLFNELGFNVGPLLGAAGIVGVAVGFASQTSVSNIISGMFLIAEKPFVVGDIIIVGELKGRVLSVDFLSVKIRTFDNQFVRVPNETIIKSQVINVTRFPIRRVDLSVGVAYKEDMRRVREVLLDVAVNNELVLNEPAPLVIFKDFADSSIHLVLAAWAERDDWWTVKRTLAEDVQARFAKEGIEIPFPHRSLYAGSATEPFPVRVVGADDTEES